MRQWLYYTQLAVLDLWRLRVSVQSHVVVVAGICLPILLLQGLKRGHVGELRKELQGSPSGRRVEITSSPRTELLTLANLEVLRRSLPEVELAVPGSTLLADLTFAGPDGGRKVAEGATFDSTAAGDPNLRLHGVDIAGEGHGVVLRTALADHLGVKAGDRVRLGVTRGRGSSASADLVVRGVVPGTAEQLSGYLDAGFLDLVAQFKEGYRVPAMGWPSSGQAAPVGYAGYLLFCEPDGDLSTGDHAALERAGYVVEPVEDASWKSLYGVLNTRSLRVYFVHTRDSHTDPRARLDKPPTAVTKLTRADDVAIPWTPPCRAAVAGRPRTVVGVSVPSASWLAKVYLVHPDAAFEAGQAETDRVQFLGRAAAAGDVIDMVVAGRGELATVKLNVVPTPPGGFPAPLVAATGAAVLSAGDGNSEVAVVPADLLAHFDAHTHGRVQFDPALNRFVAFPREIDYPSARLFARTIDDVPAVAAALGELGYLQKSENSRIREIQKQTASLGFIVIVVGVGVWLFGVVTVSNVFGDATARKRGMIGILRVVGVSRAGIFYIILLRAAVLGAVAAALTLAVGFLLPWPLRRLPELAAPGWGWGAAAAAAAGLAAALLLGARRRSVTQADPPRVAPRYLAIAQFLALAAAVLAAGGYLLAGVLDFHPIDVRGSPTDALVVFGSALTCCVIGSLAPAWTASRMDPFEAIVEGRFR